MFPLFGFGKEEKTQHFKYHWEMCAIMRINYLNFFFLNSVNLYEIFVMY